MFSLVIPRKIRYDKAVSDEKWRKVNGLNWLGWLVKGVGNKK